MDIGVRHLAKNKPPQIHRLNLCLPAEGGKHARLNSIQKLVIPAGKRVSSAMDGKLKSIHGAWIPAIHAGMTILDSVIM